MRDLSLQSTSHAGERTIWARGGSRRVFIPKSNGDKRPLSIGNIIDRGIQGALREVFEHIYEQDFLNCSFSFRPKRSAHNALATLNYGIREEGLKYFLEVDLENFFGTINHKWLMEFLGPCVHKRNTS